MVVRRLLMYVRQPQEAKKSEFCCIQGEVARACEGRAPWVALKGKFLDKDGLMPYHARAFFVLII